MQTLKGKLKDGVEIGGKSAFDFEMRAATTGDMFDAEELADVSKPVAYKGALISRQLVCLGDMPGPIDFEVIRRLTPGDFSILYDTLKELECLGKPESAAKNNGTT